MDQRKNKQFQFQSKGVWLFIIYLCQFVKKSYLHMSFIVSFCEAFFFQYISFIKLLKFIINKNQIMFPNLFQELDENQLFDDKLKRKTYKKEGQKEKILFSKNRKQYYWNDFQQKRYLIFVKQSIEFLQLPVQQRKRLKINILMSQKVKSRNPAQCHTHHQKMLHKYKNIQGILQNHLYLFDDYQSNGIKDILKNSFGEKKSADQILSLSQAFILQKNEFLQDKQQLFADKTIKINLNSSALIIPRQNENYEFNLQQKELQWIQW